jgi:hypothetical protein
MKNYSMWFGVLTNNSLGLISWLNTLQGKQKKIKIKIKTKQIGPRH